MCLWKMPKIKMPSISGRELLPSTQSKDPDAPKYGGSDDWKRRKGTESLRIQSINNTGDETKNGGWNI